MSSKRISLISAIIYEQELIKLFDYDAHVNYHPELIVHIPVQNLY